MPESVYEKVELLYQKNKDSFFQLENEFKKNIDIDINISKDTIKGILVTTINSGQNEHLFKKNSFLRNFILYYIVMGYFLFLCVFGKRETKTQKFDVLFDNWSGNNFTEYYSRLYDNLAKIVKVGVFDTNSKVDENYFPKDCSVLSRTSNHTHWYSRKISLKILKAQYNKFFFYQRLSNYTNINIVRISLMMNRYIAIYSTDMLSLNSKILISAGDNYYNAMRYYIYKTHAIENILLIQNAHRLGFTSNVTGDMYTYCDSYYGFGPRNINDQKGMVCKNKKPIGSLRLYNNAIYKYPNDNIEYDIVFIEQLALVKQYDFDVDLYLLIIDMIYKFALKHKKYRILYTTRPNRIKRFSKMPGMLEHIHNIDNKLIEADIIIDDLNSYKSIKKSNIVVHYCSTMGMEALGLDKRVLCCNLDKQAHLISDKDEISCLVDKSYELFEFKLLNLLENTSNEIDNYYKDKKRDFMNLRDDPVEIICNDIKELLSQ